MNEVRTRFAPSPTGYMHIGNLRTALYEYLVARKYHGKFVLRIEDTDQERFVEDALKVIYNTINLVGMTYDEGPDKEGPYGPYVQSERLDLYLPYGRQLVEKDGAYYCFCSKERLETLKSDQLAKGEFPKYDGCCRHLSEKEIQENLEAGIPYVIRQKMPETGVTSFDDAVFGHIEVDNQELEDQILIKSDGYPTYNFANVIDDHLMKISHVVRGSEYLSSTPKYNLLYEAFEWEKPIYIHLPLILNEDGQKLSKRLGDQSFEDLVEQGYLIEAITNFVALLGWSPGSEREFFTLKELEENFTIEGISKSPSVFDRSKLKWMNGEYIRKLSLDDFHQRALPYIEKTLTVSLDTYKIASILQKRTEILTDIPEQIGFLNGLTDYDTELYVHKKMKTTKEIALESLRAGLVALQKENDFSYDHLHQMLMDLVQTLGLKNGQLLWPLRVALTGQNQSPGGALEILEILGKEESLKRIEKGIRLLEEEVC